jgi:DNA-binding response OmpR family regulator
LRILLVEDDVDLADAVCSLRAKAFVVDVVGRLDARAAPAHRPVQRRAARPAPRGRRRPVADACRARPARAAGGDRPDRARPSDRIRGLDAGADDTSPSRTTRRAAARLRAVQRPSGGESWCTGSLQIDLANDLVRRDGVRW